MIPGFDAEGDLPPGVHRATLDEIETHFGNTTISIQRRELFAALKPFLREAMASGVVKDIFLGGSLVISQAHPNDVDCVIVLHPNVTYEELRPDQYIFVSRRIVRRRFRDDRLDIMTVRTNTTRMNHLLSFFQTTRAGKDRGIVEVIFHGNPE